MTIDLLVPALGESVVEATVAKWMKSSGDSVNADEPIVELETEKVTLEVPSPVSGILHEIVANEGANVEVGALLGILSEEKSKEVGNNSEPTLEKPLAKEPNNQSELDKKNEHLSLLRLLFPEPFHLLVQASTGLLFS